jgi:Na+-translocating ferredoxin:NAD+ oxidoreductase RnfG subunit
LLTAVVFVSVLLLTWTNSITSKKIEEQGDAAVLVLIRGIFPDMSRYTRQDNIFIIYDNGNTIGYAFMATGQGYGGNISILVGLQDETTVNYLAERDARSGRPHYRCLFYRSV